MSLDFNPIIRKSIELTPDKTWIHMDIIKAKNHEIYYLNMRKHVKTKKYTGPATGFIVDTENIEELLHALSEISSKIPVFGEDIPLPVYEEFNIGPGKDLRVTLNKYDDKSELSVDVRIWVTSEIYSGPTKQGVTFHPDKLVNVIMDLSQIEGECLDNGY